MSGQYAELVEQQLKEFEEWFLRNYPPDCILGRPEWHAPKIWRAATHRFASALTTLTQQLDKANDGLIQYARDIVAAESKVDALMREKEELREATIEECAKACDRYGSSYFAKRISALVREQQQQDEDCASTRAGNHPSITGG